MVGMRGIDKEQREVNKKTTHSKSLSYPSGKNFPGKYTSLMLDKTDTFDRNEFPMRPAIRQFFMVKC